jgi:hypothetical protein
LHVEVIELDRIGLRIEVGHRIGADARVEHETVVAGATD